MKECSESGDKMNNNNILKSSRPATYWHSGYPVGNGKTGAMVSGEPYCERIALNYDTLWRNYSKYYCSNTAKNFREIQRLCYEKRWDEAQKLVMETVPASSEMLYVNPYVPAGDIYITSNYGEHYINDYLRTLDLQSGIAESSCRIKGVTFKKQTVSLYDYDVLLIRLSASKAGSLFGEIALSRLDDPECTVDGISDINSGIINGKFEEGVEFSVKYRVLNNGGRLTGYGDTYCNCGEDKTAIEALGTHYNFRKRSEFNPKKGIHCSFDSVNELFIAVAIADDGDCRHGEKPEDIAGAKLDKFLNKFDLFDDYDEIISENTKAHRELYDRVSIDLGGSFELEDDILLRKAHESREVPVEIIEKLFNMGRYIAVCSGRPNGKSAPINLQGIWNQDRRPAWDSDYHLDLNVEMCYWPLGAANLTELYLPLIDWAMSLVPQAEISARDLYGCNGILFAVSNDLKNIGCPDHMGYAWTGAAAWLAQTMYMYYEYTGDRKTLETKLYPFMRKIAEFYEDFLYETPDGSLIPIPSASMEAMIKGRNPWSIMSSPSSMDLELIHWLLKTAADTAVLLGVDAEKIQKWYQMNSKVPDVGVREDGSLCEHLDNEELDDPGHRHRSALIGLCPMDIINYYDTPELMPAAQKFLEERRRNCPAAKIAWEKAWDVELYAVFHSKDMVSCCFEELVNNFMLENYMLTGMNTVSDNSPWFDGVPILQVEANLGIISGIIECIVQEHGGVIEFIPALPSNWHNGKLCGVLLKNGISADIYWENNALEEAALSLKNDISIKINLPKGYNVLRDGVEIQAVNQTGGARQYEFKSGKYIIKRGY